MAEARGTAEMARTDRAPATHPRPCIPGHASSAWLAWPIGSGNLPSRAYVIFSAALQHLRSGCGAPASKPDPTSPRREASLLNLPVIQVVTGLFLAFSRSAADLRTVRASFRTYFESGTQGSDEPPWTALSFASGFRPCARPFGRFQPGRDGTADRTPAHASSVQYPWCTERPGGEVPEWVYLGGVNRNRIKPKQGSQFTIDRHSDASGCPTGR